MSQEIDRRIAILEQELASLRHQKLAALKQEIAALEASFAGREEAPFAARGRGRPRKEASAPPASGNATAKKKGRRPRGKHVPDEEAIAALTLAVTSAGDEGISARAAAAASGLFYPRVIRLMDAHFKKSGTGKWTRYTA